MEAKPNLICCIFLLFIVSCGDQEKIENLESNREVGESSSKEKDAGIRKIMAIGYPEEEDRNRFSPCRIQDSSRVGDD